MNYNIISLCTEAMRQKSRFVYSDSCYSTIRKRNEGAACATKSAQTPPHNTAKPWTKKENFSRIAFFLAVAFLSLSLTYCVFAIIICSFTHHIQTQIPIARCLSDQ